MKTLKIATALAAALCLCGTAGAQWLSFTDETAALLTLEPFADNPGGDPLLDDEEKDIVVGDLDQDGDDDVIVVRKKPFSIPGARQDVLLMNEGGALVDRTSVFAPGFLAALTDARDVFLGDFTGDGWLDAVIANTFGEQPRFYRNQGEDGGGNWLGLIDESAARLPFISVPGDVSTLQFCAVWGGDVDGDLALDLYFSNYRSSGGTTDVLMMNDGSGFFTNESAARLGSNANVAFGTSVEIHDMDEDGDNDIVKISTLYNAPPFDIGQFILYNDGTGNFDTLPFEDLPSASPYMFTVGDLNGDDVMDMLNVGDVQDRTLIAQGASQHNMSYSTNVFSSNRTDGFGGNTKLADMDNDGDLDGAVGPIDVDIQNCGFSDEFALFENPGDGDLVDPYGASQNFHVDPHDFALVDIDLDGCMDMFMGLCTGWRVFTQDNCAAGGIPCADLDRFQARCIETPGGIRIQYRAILTDGSHDGEPVTFEIDGTPDVRTINNDRAQGAFPGAAGQTFTVSLTDPAGCFPDRVVTCPDPAFAGR